MPILRKADRKAPSRNQVNIKGVRDGILLLPRSRYRLVMEVSSINFELKSEEEQDILIDTYESFLNSLPCPLQILVRIRELDITNYLSDLDARKEQEAEEVYRDQIDNYTEFVNGLVVDNSILSRRFYVMLPYEATDFDTAKVQLTINADMVTKGLMRLGIRARQLDSLELLDLFHHFYNPEQAKRQPITDHVVSVLNSTYTQGLRP